MNPESENFEKLQKLLALKRYEQPPPRYFNEFSGKVIDRLQQMETHAAQTWWQKLGLDFDLKPAFVCAFGVTVSALMLLGVLTSTGQATAVSALADNSPAGYRQMSPYSSQASTAPVGVAPSSAFDQFTPHITLASY